MANNGTGNQTFDSDFLKVLLALKQNVMKSLNSSDVCSIETVNPDSYSCKSLGSGDMIECYALKDLVLTEKDIVVIIYPDYDFRSNLRRIKNNKELQYVNQESRHTKDCGIIIGVLYKEA